jgi:hypothetical protein
MVCDLCVVAAFSFRSYSGCLVEFPDVIRGQKYENKMGAILSAY